MSPNHRICLKAVIFKIVLAGLGRITLAQSTEEMKRVFTLEEAVNFALKNYPAVRASLERVAAAQAGVSLTRTSYRSPWICPFHPHKAWPKRSTFKKRGTAR